jgi:MFS family permease
VDPDPPRGAEAPARVAVTGAPQPRAPSAAQRYARVLRAPDVARLFGAGILARLPIGIDTLAAVLFVRARSGSFAVAGVAAAGFGLGSAVGNPLQGRLIDRHGHARVLLPLAAVHACALAAMVALGATGAPSGTLAACALVAGMSLPAVGAVIRPLLPGLLGGRRDLLATAYAVDGIAIEIVFVCGPLITAAVVAVVSPAAALLLACGVVLAGTALLVTAPASRRWRPLPSTHERPRLGALASPGLRTLMAASAPVGFALGATEVSMIAFAVAHGSRAAAGALLALWAAGSGLGGLVYGARAHERSPSAVWVRLAVLFPLLSLPLVLGPSIPAMAPLCVIAGAGLAPLLAAANQVIGDVAPAGAVTEAFTWPVTALGIGVACGSAVAGALVQADGWRSGFVAVVTVGAAGAAVAVARRRTLPS